MYRVPNLQYLNPYFNHLYNPNLFLISNTSSFFTTKHKIIIIRILFLLFIIFIEFRIFCTEERDFILLR